MTDKAEVLFGENQEESTARTEAPTLTAGRALDALVAEKVMGFRRSEAWLDASPRHYADPEWPDYTQETPRYSTDIGAAWQVVENLADRGWKVDVQNRYYPCWAVHVHFPLPDTRNVFETSELLFGAVPHAICLAALKAVSPSQTEEGK